MTATPDEVMESSAAHETRSFADQWITEYLLPSQQQVVYNGIAYPLGQNVSPAQLPGGMLQTIGATHIQNFEASLPGHASALRSCPPAFAAELVRALVLSQARFVFRNRPGSANARKTFGTRDLAILESPWPNGTTADLIGQMEWHAGLAGNAFIARTGNRLRILRPDWVALVWGSDSEPDTPQTALDGRLLGYIYINGGFTSGNRPQTLTVDQVAHWYPLPDPLNPGLGMSWVTPAVREIRGDLAATEHKLKFFANGATPNLVIKGIPATTSEQFDAAVAMMERRHAGLWNAYKTLYLTAGADATVVGSNMSQMDFSSILSTGETRLSVLSRVPAALLGITEGLKGAALNAGNFSMARRIFSDTWVTPTLQNLANSLSTLVAVPPYAELWFDVADVPLMREDAADAANIINVQASTVAALVNAGYASDKVVAAVTAGDLTQLIGAHSGLLSVQLQAPGSGDPAPASEGKTS